MATPQSIGTAFSPEEKSAAKQLFISFLEDHLGVQFRGFQNAYGHGEDLILFAGPSGSTLAVPASVLYEPRDVARRIIQEKVATSTAAFDNDDKDMAEACGRWWTNRSTRRIAQTSIGRALANRGAA